MNRAGALITVLLLALLPACGEEGKEGSGPRSVRSQDERREDDVVVSASVDAATVDIGARVTYRVEVRFRDNVEVDWPPILDQVDHQVVFDTGIWKEEEQIGTYRRRSLETVLDPGIGPVLEIRPTVIRWRRKDEERWREARTETITVEVTSVAEGAPEFQEPLDFFDLPEPPKEQAQIDRRLLAIIVGGSLILLAVFFIVLFRKRRERAIVPPTPEETALAELERLDQLGLLDAARVKELYYRLSAILRRYIEGRFGIEAPEQTTEEFLTGLRGEQRLPDDRKEALRGFMGVADLVRYARHEPPTEEVRGAVTMLRDFVESSRPLAAEEIGADVEKEVAGAL